MPPFQQPPQNIVLKSTSQVAVNGIKVLVYGGAGVGKTRLSATAPSPVILSAESGLLSLRKYNLPYIEISSFDTLVNAYQWAMNSAEARQFATICIDSISEIAEVILDTERRATKDPRKAYGEMAIQVMQLLRNFRDMPGRNVYFASKMARITDQTSGGTLWGPLMPGQQLDQQLPYFTDEVFHLANYPQQDGSLLAALRTRPDNQYQAKDRSGALDLWERPDLSYIFDKIAKG
jgi:hypothetical protein